MQSANQGMPALPPIANNSVSEPEAKLPDLEDKPGLPPNPPNRVSGSDSPETPQTKSVLEMRAHIFDTLVCKKDEHKDEETDEDDAVVSRIKKRPADLKKRPAAAATHAPPTKKLKFPGEPTKRVPPLHYKEWTIFTDINGKKWRCQCPAIKPHDKTASWRVDPEEAWEKVCEIVGAH